MNKETILVTGGTGFIGSHTTVELQAAGYDVIIVDNLSNSDVSVLDGIEKISGKRPKFYEADCNDYDAMKRIYDENPDLIGVIHFAASKAVGESVEKPLLYYYNNIVSLLNQLRLLRDFDKRGGIVFSSSCTVYGQPEKLPVDETAPFEPATSPYGNTKQINEEILRDTIHAGVPFKAISLRYFNPIGAHPSALIGEEPRGVPANLVPYVTQAAAGIRKELTIFGDDYPTRDGTCIRDYIHVVDLAKAHVAAMDRMLHRDGEQYEYFNIGTGEGESVLELVHAFEKATGVPVPYKIGPRREGDIVAVWADAAKANDVLGWRAESSIEDSLRSAWAWQKHVMERDKR